MKKRVFVLGHPGKEGARTHLDEMIAWLPDYAEVVGHKLGRADAIPPEADLVITIGGDGTILGAAHAMGCRQIPIVGVNQGKLGFLAEFTAEDLRKQIDRVLEDETLISRRMILSVRVERDGQEGGSSLAINDCVIHAGPPYRIIELRVTMDGQLLTDVSGDGLIISSPSGSTAHNLSAGGPILEAGVQAMVLTPICAHSLTHHPLVVECSSRIEVTPLRANEGTTVSTDGQVSSALGTGDRLIVTRSDQHFQLVRSPDHVRWHTLMTKLNWGRPPSYKQSGS